MEKTFYYIFASLLIFLTYQNPCTSKTLTNLATDQSSLLAFKSHITSDPSLTITKNWTTSSFVCSWIGVTCSARHQRVAALNISGMSLSGAIPPQLGNLSFLVSLDLKFNNFSGTLPHELSALRRLKFLSVTVNNLRGEIPLWLPFLPKLEYISLRNNSFTGSVPKSISNLTNLYYLDLSFNSLDGEIPQELGKLQKLQIVAIQYNHLEGSIPSSLFNISSLKALALRSNALRGILPNDLCANLPFVEGFYLSYNQLSGQIPSNFSGCSQLKILSLAYNSFSGHIPATTGDLKFLQILELGGNQLRGALPPHIFNISSLKALFLRGSELEGNLSNDIGNLTMLTNLDVSFNKFTGVIPVEVGHLYQLETLSLGPNMFTGSIPQEIFNISSLLSLSLLGNVLSGSLPTNLCSGFPFLKELYFGLNNLSGSIPESISNCSKLTILDLGNNKFTGPVPHSLEGLASLEILILSNNSLSIGSSSSELSFITSLTNCKSLKYLEINDNPLDGSIPSSIGNLSSQLQRFSAFNCKIRGEIPAEIGNLTELFRLSLSDNKLSGNIPPTVKQLLKLQGFYIQNNNIRGFIPEGLCDLRSLSQLDLSENELSGPIPECFGNLASLNYLWLESNMLTSSIPSSLWTLKNLLLLDLSSNSFNGFMPPEVGNLVGLIYMNLSMNQLSNSIPSSITSLRNLVSLSLAHNKFEGPIPESIGNMISSETLDLSYNNLSGSLPKSLQALQHLNEFNVSFNALSGQIPSGGPFMNFTVESFEGNKALCGVPRFHIPPCHVVSNQRSKRKKVQFALFILAGVVAFITILCLGFIFLRYKRKVEATIEINGALSIEHERISYLELSRATEQFSESNLLGIGSFGSVFKGTLGDGKVVAVKVFKLISETAFRSFDVECEVLRNIRHRNLAKVISSCSNEEFKALVVEYMPKGSLEKWLYSQNLRLNFMQRLEIMTDVVSALEYLHHGNPTPIVHCDLKPSNVLLDEEMVARVSDFGISKLLGEEESVVVTNTLATLGYIAPEYGFEGLVSTRCDVYSYGVMLMETFARKRPSDDMFGGDLSLKTWIENSVPQSTYEVMDANLLMDVDEEHGDRVVEFTSYILELAFKCSAESPTERINMKEVGTELQKIKRQFLGRSLNQNSN